MKTPMQMLRAIANLDVDDEGDIIIPGRAEREVGRDMVRELREVIRANKGVK